MFWIGRGKKYKWMSWNLGSQEWEMTSEPDDDDLLKLLVSNINWTSRFKYEKGYCDDCKEEVEIEEYEE